MTTEVMKQAIEALEMQFKGADAMGWSTAAQKVAITALRQAIEQASLDTLSDLTPKREAFANAVASGMTQADAYRHASLDTSQSHSCTWPSCNPDEPGPVGEVVSYGSHLHPEWFSGRVPLLGTLLYTAPPAQAKEIEGLKAATHVRIPADEYEALRQLQFYTRIPGQENMVLRFLKEIEDCDHRKNAAIAQQKEMK